MYPPVRGVLRVREGMIPELHRTARVAELIEPDSSALVADVLPLFDAALIFADGQSMTITGFERVWSAGRLIDYAQTWLVSHVEVRK